MDELWDVMDCEEDVEAGETEDDIEDDDETEDDIEDDDTLVEEVTRVVEV